MTNKSNDSKLQDLRDRFSEATQYDPVDTPEEVVSRILNTQMNVIDTVEEVDAQKNNLGPKDTKIENQKPELAQPEAEEEPEPSGPIPS